jgi:hypothetical protein
VHFSFCSLSCWIADWIRKHINAIVVPSWVDDLLKNINRTGIRVAVQRSQITRPTRYPANQPKKGKAMFDSFIQSEWQQLCAHLGKCAEEIAQDCSEKTNFVREAEGFSDQVSPERYRDLLERTADASRLAVTWQCTRDANFAHDDALIDEASIESFPASDPPTFSHAHA